MRIDFVDLTRVIGFGGWCCCLGDDETKLVGTTAGLLTACNLMLLTIGGATTRAFTPIFPLPLDTRLCKPTGAPPPKWPNRLWAGWLALMCCRWYSSTASRTVSDLGLRVLSIGGRCCDNELLAEDIAVEGGWGFMGACWWWWKGGGGRWWWLRRWCWWWAPTTTASARANISLTCANFDTDDADGEGDRCPWLALISGCRDWGEGREERNRAGGGGGSGIDEVMTGALNDVGGSGGGKGGENIVNGDGDGIGIGGGGGGGGKRYWEIFWAYLFCWVICVDRVSTDLNGTQ